MKKRFHLKLSLLFACLSLLLLSQRVNAQALTGTKTVPGDYSSISAAVAALNTNGVGTGGVTINVAAGYTETLTSPIVLTATGTVANPIVFQKSGVGANPVLTAFAGTRLASAGDSLDVIWTFVGSDYVTISQIDLKDTGSNNTPTLMMEVGYGFYKANATDGANNNTVQNCTITLNRENTTTSHPTSPRSNVAGSVGIEVMNSTNNAVSVALTVTTVSGASSNNKFYGNTIQNCNFGIAMGGFAATTPYTLADVNNDIGGSSLVTGNTIINFGGGTGATVACGAISMHNQWSFNASYNTINNNNGSGVDHPNTNRGIWLNASSVGASCDITNNKITISGGTNTAVNNYCLSAELAQSGAAGNTVNINNNQFLNCKVLAAATANFHAIYLQSGATTVNVNNNYVYGFTYAGVPTGATGIIWTQAPTVLPGTLNMNNNTIDSTVLTGMSGTGNLAVMSVPSGAAPTVAMNMNNNAITRFALNAVGAGSSLMYGIYYSGATPTTNMSYNTIDDYTRNGTTGGNTVCIYHGGGASGTTFVNQRKNIVKNVSISGSGTAGGITGIQFTAGTILCDSNTVFNLSVQKTTGTGSIIGITGGSSNIETTTANTVYNLTHLGTGSGTIIGISSAAAANGLRTVSYNTVYTLNSTGGAVTGISSGIGIPSLMNNKVYDITTGGTTAIVSGIALTGGSAGTHQVYNNLVSGITAPASNGGTTPTVRGISMTVVPATTTFAVSYNTVLLTGSSTGAAFSSAGLYHTFSATATSGSLDMRNNIIVNKITPSGTGVTAAIWRSANTSLVNYATTSNRNLLYAGIPSANNVIMCEGAAGTLSQDSAAFRTRMSPRDTNSFFTEDPAFLSTVGSSAQFLKLNPLTATYSEGSARNISGITKDFDNTTRAGNAGYVGTSGAPDMGAWEAENLGQPVNQMYFDSASADQATTSVVPSGTSNNIILKVRVYVGKGYNGLEATSFKLNTSTTNTVTDISAAKIYYTGTDNNFSTAQLFGTTASPGTTFYVTGSKRLTLGVNYFWVVYDISNTAVFGNYVDAAVDSITLSGINQPLITGDPAGNRQIKTKLNGLVDVGSGHAYTSLTSAVNDLVSLGVTGPVTLSLTDAQYDSVLTNEVFPIVLGAYPGSSATNTVTIRPAVAATRIVGIGLNPIFQFNGGSNYIIDGSPAGNGTFVSGNNLIVENTNVMANTIKFINDADSNSILYVDVKGADTLRATTAGAGVINIGTGITTGNDNNTIRYCDIHESTAGYPAVAISAIGSATTVAMNNDGNTIEYNNIYNYFTTNGTSSSSGIYVGANNGSWNINSNRFYQTSARIHTSAAAHRALWISAASAATTSASGFTVNNNYIGGADAAGSGKYDLRGSGAYTFNAMDIAVGTGTVTNVQGNTITDIIDSSTSTSAGVFVGITLAGGKISLSDNLIGSRTVNGAISLIVNSTTGGGFNGINSPAAAGAYSNFSIFNNIISGVDVYGGSLTTAPELVAMVMPNSAKIYNNLLGDTTLLNSLHIIATSTSTVTAQRAYGILFNTTTGVTDSVYNNVIANIVNEYAGNSTSYSLTRGMSVVPNAGFGTLYIANNTIRNIYTSSKATGAGTTAALTGIAVNTSSAGNFIVTGNTIYGLKLNGTSTATATQVTGILSNATGATSTLVSRNLIHTLEIPGLNPSAILTGIDITGGSPIVANNMIRMGIDSMGGDITAPIMLRGISKGAATAGIYFNTVYIGGISAGGTTTRTYAFQRTGAGTDNVRNNIFQNNRVNGSIGGGNFAVGLNNNTTLTQNYNVLMGDSIGLYGATQQLTLADWKLASSMDGNSLSSNISFVNAIGTSSSVDLHIDGNTATPIEAYGAVVSVTGTDVDFDGQTRSGLTPVDLGADAGNFTPFDIAPPVIVYTPLANSIDSTNRTITATITDGSGIYTSVAGGFAPRIYFAKKNELPTWNSAVGTQTAGTPQNGTWQFTINTAIFTTAPTGNDTIYYYVVAQDSTINNNVGSFPTGATGLDVNSVTPPPSPSWYKVIPVLGATTFQVGAAQTFTTLTGANGLFNYLNTSVIGGDIVVQLVTDSIEEPGTFGLNQLTEAGLGGYKVRIEPDAAAERLLVGNITTGGSGLIRLDGCDRVIIDGSYAGSGHFIRIKNRGNGNTIHLINDADKDTITNCIIEGMNTYAATIVFYGTNVVGGSGNDSNAIIGCIIRDTIGATGTNMPNTGFYSVLGNNDYNTFSNNEVYNFGFGGMYVEASKVDNFWTISNNKFYQQRLKNQETLVIRIHSGSGHTISGNSIGGAAADRSGTAWTTSGTGTTANGIVGILIPNNIGTTYPIYITNNTISNFGSTTPGVSAHGIAVFGGVVYVQNNTIGGGMNLYDTIVTGGNASTSVAYGGISIGSNSVLSNIRVTGNLVSNISYYGAAASHTAGIAVNSSQVTAILIDSNIVRNISGNNTSTSSAVANRLGGIVVAAAPTNTLVISRNKISNIQSTNTGTAAYVPAGIVMNSTSSATITRNWIKNVGAVGTGTGTGAPVVSGIQLVSGVNNMITHNQVSLGDSAMNESVVYGISDYVSTAGTNTYAYNSVYVNGATATGANNSAAFYRNNTTSVNCINNILYNDRTTLGTGTSYAVALNSATGVNNTTLNYNLMLVADTSKLMMLPTGTNNGWAGLNSLFTTTYNTNWAQTTALVDDASLFVNSAQGDLHIVTTNPEAWYANGKGKRITTLSGDFDNATGVRSTSITTGSTDIGSVEFTPTSTPPLTYADKAPVPGDSTLFFFASRMVAKLNWDFTGSLPASVDARYYSGEKAPNLIAGRTAMNAYCDFQTNGGSAYGSVLTLMMDSTHFGDVVNASNLNVAKYDGTQWTKDSNTIINNIAGTFTSGITNIGGLGIYTGTDGSNNPLPVRMTTFTAKVNNGDVIVDWKTASEMNNRGFEIERSLDGRSFETVGFVKGAGNSNTVLSYMYNDKAAFAKTSAFVLYYRLKQVDMNGAFNYSNIARVSINNKEVNAVSAYPNPFTTEMQVSFNATVEGKASVRILNIQGMTVAEQTATATKGMNRLDIESLTSLPKGMYFVELTVNGETTVIKVVKN